MTDAWGMRSAVLGFVVSTTSFAMTACHSDGATAVDETDGTSESGTSSEPGTSTAPETGTVPATTTDDTGTPTTTTGTPDDSESSGTPGESESSGTPGDSSSSGTPDESSSDTTTTTDGGSSTDGSESTGGDGGAAFPEAPAFGTNVLDLDLVGSWGLNWVPESGFDSVIEIDDGGGFVWRETSADCSGSTTASGYLWVEGVQIVMHVDTWERPLPWDTEAVLGEVFEPPFRMRLSFSLQGNGEDAYLAIAAPQRVTETAPYLGASYVRTVQAGAYLGGSWRGEAELQAIPDGASEPVTIVRDVYEALLDAELGADAEGTGTRAVTTVYFPVPQAFYDYDGGNWTCMGGCPAGSGLTLVDGSNLFTYGPYAGYEHLLTFVDGRTFRRDVVSDCP